MFLCVYPVQTPTMSLLGLLLLFMIVIARRALLPVVINAKVRNRVTLVCSIY